MSFYRELVAATTADKERLLARAVILDCLAGRVSLETYLAFLTEAYHHVKHTVPLLMAVGSRLPARLDWLRDGVVEYVREEHGHERWILEDIAACGGSPREVAAGAPSLATELMVSFAYDTVERVNPVGFFGMVFVLEGTSVAIASRAADIIQDRLGLPNGAFRYLRSHGALDLKHIEDFETLMCRIEDRDDRAAVIHCARVIFKLYGDVFDGLPRAVASASQAAAKEVA